MRKQILRQIVDVLIGLTFLVPLVVLPSTFIFPFIVPKILLFRSLALFMFAGWLLLIVADSQTYKLRMKSMTVCVFLFFVSLALSTFIGVDWYRSFWDNHERMLGLFTLVHFGIYYLVLTSVYKTWTEWRLLLRIFLLSGILVMFIGFMQVYVSPNLLLNGSSHRVSATLGNAIYYSGFGLFLVFVSVLLILKEKRDSAWFWFYLAGILLGFGGIFWGGTRGTLLGLIAFIAVALFLYILFLRDPAYRTLRQRAMYLMGVGLFIVVALFAFRKTDFVQHLPAVGRLVNTQLTSGTADTRVMAWGVAIEGWKEKPIFGWGPNNYYYAFDQLYRPQFLEHGWGETWFDNAHSAIFNTLAVQGIIGLVLYLSLFIIPITVLWRAYRRGQVDIHIFIMSSAFLVAHFIHNAFVFENPTSYLYFFFTLAFVNSMVTMSPIENGKKIVKGSGMVSSGMAVTLIVVTSILVYATDINPARANTRALSVLQQLRSNPATAITSFPEAAKIPTPHIDDVRNDFSRTVDSFLTQYQTKIPLKDTQALYQLAVEQLKKNVILHPLDIRLYILLAELDRKGSDIMSDPTLVLSSESYLETAHTLSPKRQQVVFALANIKHQLGKNDEAIVLLQQVVEDDPKIAESWWRLALQYAVMGRNDKGLAVMNDAEAQGLTFDDQGQKLKQALMASATATIHATQE
ncbi:MAG: hypothetical protein COU32_01010 [Candidatus Magasanikbacteria bacterium CG10_big_fil_rev_8_21_14_0_10_42_10]|uniref:O-antigen ligase-related domain-containing protein n=2 Tax=Candidatus Magasanikiibacteriota TaxID=1752731 RepID=A0A2H0TWT9_9BACT|nr:MAG: hypothetical protein COU32_01010 [Candidatus Magasanikbacteria bacterium CG10_big_fil_rev_8_21_14_0_10_42_10]PIZ94059.1 MAG: hypothetical protein COX82_01400 [Candidatus Magasanikbacteria bacterium CG_4_10_14_0_2_um_filter_41_10]